MATIQELTQGMLTLRGEFEAQEAKHVARMAILEQEVMKLQGKLREKESRGGNGRDLFIAKKGFTALPHV